MQAFLDCTDRTLGLFKIRLDALSVLVLMMIWTVWGILRTLRIL